MDRLLRSNLEKLYYQSGAPAWVEIGDVGCINNRFNFSTMKMVVDIEAGEYVRAICFGKEYDLSGIAIYSAASGIAPHLYCESGIKGTTAGGGTVYIDSMIITENEPL